MSAPLTSQNNLRFLRLGLSITKQIQSDICEYGRQHSSMCYHRTATGNVVSTADNKAYILTVAHLFSNTPEEYLLEGQGVCVPFTYSVADNSAEKQRDITLIPIGEYEPRTRKLIFTSNSTFQGNFHIHEPIPH